MPNKKMANGLASLAIPILITANVTKLSKIEIAKNNIAHLYNVLLFSWLFPIQKQIHIYSMLIFFTNKSNIYPIKNP